ncbi:MAG: mismatch repair protein MutT [Candidatus Saccharibacteria bacterium]|nr:mismatch repair protein MutT [Candidatus Saccharibacteria bacterium]
MATSTWQTKSSKIVYENPWIFVREDKTITPDGKDGLYGVVESKNESVFVIPIDDKNNTYIVQQEHYTTRELTWQCVAGRTDGEPIEIAAKRELLEEAGLRASSIMILSRARTAAGISTFRSNICLARELETDMSVFDKNEITKIKKVSLDVVRDMILAGEITATESIASFLLAIAYLEKEKKL